MDCVFFLWFIVFCGLFDYFGGELIFYIDKMRDLGGIRDVVYCLG